MFFFCAYFANAQEKITSMPAIPEKGIQTMWKYIESHSVSEMDNDTVTLANVYGVVGYSFMDKYIGVMTRSFFVLAQDVVFEDSVIKDKKEILYVPVSPNKYEQTPAKVETIKNKIKADFVLNGQNFFFFRKDKFTVKAEWYYGKKKVTFHCLTYRPYYILDIHSDTPNIEDDKKLFEESLHKNIMP